MDALIPINEKNFLNKIKNFFRHFFKKHDEDDFFETPSLKEDIEITVSKNSSCNENLQEPFEDLSQEQIENLINLYCKPTKQIEVLDKNAKTTNEDKETKILKLQEKLNNGKIDVFDLSDIEIDLLLNLYEKEFNN